MKLSIIIPVYNERETIQKVVDKVKAVNIEKEILIVDDGSTDGTGEILKTVENLAFKVEGEKPKTDIKVIYHLQNRGKGASIKTALSYVTGDIIIIQDGDLEYDPQDYSKLIAPIIRGETDVVYGSRILGKGKRSYWRYYWGGRFLSWLVNILYGARITDEPTCYKVFRTGVLKGLELRCQGFEFCPEVTAKLCRRGYRIKEVPISYCPRKIEEGKKIRWIDGLIAIRTLLRYRFFN